MWSLGDLKELRNLIEGRWHRRSTLIVILVFASVGLLWLFSDVEIKKISRPELLITILTLFVVYLVWRFTTSLPKASKGKVGFAVAISADTKEQRDRIAADFVATLRDLLFKSRLKYQFAFIEFPQYYAQKIQNEDDARNYLGESRCLFMIYGRARVRQIQGQDHHILDFNGLVKHRPIPQEISKHLSKEFRELLPYRLHFSTENDLFVFEITSEWMSLVARYIIGIAALVSGDLGYSQELFENLRKKVKPIQTTFPAILKIRQRLPSRLADVYFSQARFKFESWRQTRSSETLDEMKSYLDKLESINPGSYGLHLLLSIWHFARNQDLPAAKRELRKVRHERDATWRYNYAFLLAYEGNMKEAVRVYRTAFRHHCHEQILFQVEEFICWILEQEPDKVQFHFCLGLINFRGKGDYARALRDFEKFLEVAPREQFGEEMRLAENYIGNIRGQLSGNSSPFSE